MMDFRSKMEKFINAKTNKKNIKAFGKKIYLDLKKSFVRMYLYVKNNQKKSAIVVGVWFAAFICIICAGRIHKSAEAQVNSSGLIVTENDGNVNSSGNVNKHKKSKSGDTESTDKKSEDTTKASEQASEAATEAATVDVSKLNVSKTDLKDDGVGQTHRSYASTIPVPSSAIDSTIYAQEQICNCIDISKHQGTIDWAQVKAQGIDYAFIRVAYRGYESGGLAIDSMYARNITQAQANGIKVGVYCFSQATTEREALEEASLTLKCISGYNIDLPVVIDWETDTGYRTLDANSASELTNIISVFCDTVKNAGYTPMVYMCQSDYSSRVYGMTLASKYKIWVAWYFDKYNSSNMWNNRFTYGDKIPSFAYSYDVWQYSKAGKLNGISTAVDMDIYIVPKKVYEPKLNVTNTQIIVNTGGSMDFMSGVSATDSDNNDATSMVNLTITNTAGGVVSKESALKTPGKYTLSYVYADKGGTTITTTGNLYVRNVPEVYLDGALWSDNSTKTINYDYDESESVSQNYNEIFDYIRSKVKGVYYNTVAGDSNGINIKLGIAEVNKIMNDNNIVEGDYKVKINCSDSKGLSTSRTLIIHVNRPESETVPETTTESLQQQNGITQETIVQ